MNLPPRLVRVLLCVFVVACASTPPPSSSQPTPLSRWWQINPPGRGDLAAVRFDPDQLTLISGSQAVRVMAAVLLQSGGGRWEWSVRYDKLDGLVLLEQGSRLDRAQLRVSWSTRTDDYVLEAADGAAARRLDEVFARNRPAKDACAKAEVCLKAASAMWPGALDDLDSQLGNPRMPDRCEKALVGLRMAFEKHVHPLPEVCR